MEDKNFDEMLKTILNSIHEDEKKNKNKILDKNITDNKHKVRFNNEQTDNIKVNFSTEEDCFTKAGDLSIKDQNTDNLLSDNNNIISDDYLLHKTEMNNVNLQDISQKCHKNVINKNKTTQYPIDNVQNKFNNKSNNTHIVQSIKKDFKQFYEDKNNSVESLTINKLPINSEQKRSNNKVNLIDPMEKDKLSNPIAPIKLNNNINLNTNNILNKSSNTTIHTNELEKNNIKNKNFTKGQKNYLKKYNKNIYQKTKLDEINIPNNNQLKTLTDTTLLKNNYQKNQHSHNSHNHSDVNDGFIISDNIKKNTNKKNDTSLYQINNQDYYSNTADNIEPDYKLHDTKTKQSIYIKLQNEINLLKKQNTNIMNIINNKNKQYNQNIQISSSADLFLKNIVKDWFESQNGQNMVKSIMSHILDNWIMNNKDKIINKVMDYQFKEKLSSSLFQNLLNDPKLSDFLKDFISENVAQDDIIQIFKQTIKDMLETKLSQ